MYNPTSNCMNTHNRARFAIHWTLTKEKLYHHLFSTLGQPRASLECLKHDLVQWLDHHRFEKLLDALDCYLVDHSSDLAADLTALDSLDHLGVMVIIHPLISTALHTLIDWSKCFVAIYGEYPSLYDLLVTPEHILLSLPQHLGNYTFPRSLLPKSRGPLPSVMDQYFLSPTMPTLPTHASVHMSTHASVY